MHFTQLSSLPRLGHFDLAMYPCPILCEYQR
uniref:Uncharacterized protein n=1 Tax=Rhizophora mucronata TaxID=61149 RepID=A0A2P2QH50_RHIMU